GHTATDPGHGSPGGLLLRGTVLPGSLSERPGGAFPADDGGPDPVGTGTGQGPPFEKKTCSTGVLAGPPGPHTTPREHLRLLAFPGADRAPRRSSRAGRTGVGPWLREWRSGHFSSRPAGLAVSMRALLYVTIDTICLVCLSDYIAHDSL